MARGFLKFALLIAILLPLGACARGMPDGGMAFNLPANVFAGLPYGVSAWRDRV